jgi:hypothetical protein
MVTVPELIAVLREQTADMPGGGPHALREDRHGPGLLAAAWRHATFAQARAVLALFGAGLAVEAQANARASIEHAVALQRLALAVDDDQMDPLLLELAYQQQRREGKHLDYLEDLDAHAGGQHRSLLDSTRSEHDARQVPMDKSRPDVRTVLAHFRAVPEGLHLHSVYSRLSGNSHAGLQSAAPYLMRSLQHDQPVGPRPAPVHWAEALAVLCWACWAADDAMRRFLVNGDDIAARHASMMAKVGLAAA